MPTLSPISGVAIARRMEPAAASIPATRGWRLVFLGITTAHFTPHLASVIATSILTIHVPLALPTRTQINVWATRPNLNRLRNGRSGGEHSNHEEERAQNIFHGNSFSSTKLNSSAAEPFLIFSQYLKYDKDTHRRYDAALFAL
ncbi:MAG: hypothetical protein K2Y56_24540 [Methylobacterium sp.]|uniref:hypothetical protein n=1 Tax=Methylobacterium sp. TaxID=409 RepID=UPI0025E79CCC|nr:hypothetical protein [Methylobacterium sp.]MBX9934642.1 hypothetical protein [Methylobacterium sp.]